MDREEIIAILKKTDNVDNDEDIEMFLDLYGNQFKDRIDLLWQYGKFLMSRYGKRVTVEWDSEVEGFNSL